MAWFSRWVSRIWRTFFAVVQLISNWTVVLGLISGIGAAIWASWEWATQWGYLPVVLTGLFVTALMIWTLNGIVWMRRQKRPARARLAFDYSYGLALEGLYLAVDDQTNAVQISLVLRNASDGPVKYQVEQFDIIVGDRVNPNPVFKNRGGVIAKGMNTLFFYPTFSRDIVPERTTAMVRFSIKYGHPDYDYMRIMKSDLEATVRSDEKAGLVYLTNKATDEPS